MRPVPPNLLHVLDLSRAFTIGGVAFKAHETLGHAKHHVAYEFQYDDTRYLATGDAAGGFVAEAPTFARPIAAARFGLDGVVPQY